MEERLKLAERIITECFWGDYLITPRELLEKLDKSEPGFDKFIFSKIIENSSYPSKYLKSLFNQDHLIGLLEMNIIHSRIAYQKNRYPLL